MVENDSPASDDAQRAPGRPDTAEAEIVELLTGYLDDLATRTAEQVGDNAGVAVTLSVDGAPFTIGASSTLARDVDLIQYRIGTGPCLHTLRYGIGMYVADLGHDERWGEYGPKAAARGAACCVSVPVFVAGQPAAVVKIYSSEVDGLTADQRAGAGAVAPEVAGGVGLAKHLTRQAQQLDDRVAAMTTRRAIDLAIGVLMQRHNCSADSAFLMLRSSSQAQNSKIRDIAEELLDPFPGGGGGLAPFRDRPPSTPADR